MRGARRILAVAMGAFLMAASGSEALAPARVVVDGIAKVDLGHGALRTAALRDGLRRAVVQIGQDLVHAEGGRMDSDQVVGSLKGEPRDYAVRYRVLRDRGERPSLNGLAREYALEMEVYVDVEKVARSLRSAGRLSALPGELPARHHRILVETDDWAAYQLFLRALEGAGEARSIVPESFEAGRVHLLVEAPGRPPDLLDRLVRHGQAGLDVLSVGARGEELRVRVTRTSAPAGSPAQGD